MKSSQNLIDYSTVSTDSQPAKNNPKSLKRKFHGFADTPTIKKFFKPVVDKKRRVTLNTISNEQAKAPHATIAIPYRDDGEGRGALYDHRAIQAATQKPTALLNQGEYSRHLKDEIERFQYVLKFGEQLEATTHKYPPLLAEISNDYGLLLLPGVSAKEFNSPEYTQRKNHEMALISHARLIGRPILAICGGSWVLYQQYGGNIKEVTDHAYRAGMPRLSPTTGKVGNNKQIHRIKIKDGANLLRSALQLQPFEQVMPPVNSVHSYAPDAAETPNHLIITASSIQDNEIAPISAKISNTEKEKMKPEENSIEAFEAAHGAPVLGVQWHPEAYSSRHQDEPYANKHEHLINYLALAGQTFLNKQRLVSELKTGFNSIKAGLHRTDLLSHKHSVIRRTVNNNIFFQHYKLKLTHDVRHMDEIKLEIRIKENYCGEKLARNKICTAC